MKKEFSSKHWYLSVKPPQDDAFQSNLILTDLYIG